MGNLPFSERAARTVWRLLPKRAMSGAIGWWAGCTVPTGLRKRLLGEFARRYGIDVAEAEKPLEAYCGFNDFFTRHLKPGARPIAPGGDVVVSPADGTVVESGLVADGQLIQVKGVLFRLDELLTDADAAARLEGGAYLITYLSPRDYHRVHFPVEGNVTGWHHVPGSLFSVGAKTVVREPGLFVRNERFVTTMEGPAGFCTVTMVAAVGVGHITAAFDSDVATHGRAFRRAAVRHRRYDVPVRVGKGDELGVFHLGSTTVVVFEPGRVTLDRFAPGQVVRMGAAIGRVTPARGLRADDTKTGRQQAGEPGPV